MVSKATDSDTPFNYRCSISRRLNLIRRQLRHRVITMPYHTPAPEDEDEYEHEYDYESPTTKDSMVPNKGPSRLGRREWHPR